MGADAAIPPNTITGTRPEPWPRPDRLSRAERVPFSTDPPHIYSRDHLPTGAETDNLSNTSSVMDSWDAPVGDDLEIWDKKIVLSCSTLKPFTSMCKYRL